MMAAKVKFKNEDSKEIAKERLRNILISDRINVSNEVLEMIKTDIVGVVKDYFETSEMTSEVYITSSNENSQMKTSLIAVVPINKSRNKNNNV
jgi:cell division topological specificity factor